MPTLRSLTLLPVAALLLCSTTEAKDKFAFRDRNGVSLELSEGGRPVYVYNYGGILAPENPEKSRRSTYLHPVYAPDGTVITDDFNPDHPHHRGISWMWPVVVVEGKTYDLWMLGEIRQRFLRWTERATRGDVAVLGVENGWFIGERQVVKESVSIRTTRASGDTRVLDFTLRFAPVSGSVDIVGTPDQAKGYGGFCFRFAPRDGGKDGTVIRSDAGVAKKDGVMERHTWVEIEGMFGGRPERGRIDDDASNPGVPNGWLMRHGFGFLNVSYPGLTPHTLTADKPLVLRYRVTLFSGAAARSETTSDR